MPDFAYKALAYLCLAGATYIAGYQSGLRSAERKADRATITAQQHVIQTEHAQQAITASAATAHAASAAATRTVYQTIEKEVIRYVSQASTPASLLPAGWVRLHDAAALPAVPAAPGEPDGVASAFTTDDALGVVTGNYETCAETRNQLIGLQRWVKLQQAAAE